MRVGVEAHVQSAGPRGEGVSVGDRGRVSAERGEMGVLTVSVSAAVLRRHKVTLCFQAR